DVEFTTDPSNCGSCGRSCRFRHVDSPRCEASVCTYEAGDCETGWYDINGVATDGCEYSCTPADPAVETCNARDDDCDGMIDEGDPGGGGSCGVDTGACSVGTNRCVEGSVICMGAVTPSTELCNAMDDDCDGRVDENNPEGGRACGESVGSCELGRQVCTAGALVCTGATDPVPEACDGLDNDCDGQTDEGQLAGVGDDCNTDFFGQCDEGTQACEGGGLVCLQNQEPVDEICDGLDNDCDGQTDEEVIDEAGATCATGLPGICALGVEQCINGAPGCNQTDQA
ncbi:MAG: hypothetical protein KC620_26445, partial [Myxococcales bacterium]|nr:hypothetical protein [Myxococcales bacterium]